MRYHRRSLQRLGTDYVDLDQLDLSPVTSALYFSPMAITFVITNQSVLRFGGVDPCKTLFAGALLAASGTLLAYAASALIPSFTPIFLIPGTIVLGLGQSLFMTPVVNIVLTEIPERNTGRASGVLNTLQRIVNALGAAVLMFRFSKRSIADRRAERHW